MVLNGSNYYLLYSANNYESYFYATGFAVCKTPMGPCTKVCISRDGIPNTTNQPTLVVHSLLGRRS
jgi:hypothetical protein